MKRLTLGLLTLVVATVAAVGSEEEGRPRAIGGLSFVDEDLKYILSRAPIP